MNVNTVVGALIAAAILFISSMTTPFMENPDLTLADVKQSTWIVVAGGAVVAFLKDYQAVTVRRITNKLRNRADEDL